MQDYEEIIPQPTQPENEEVSVEQVIIQKKREKFQTEIRASKKKQILSQNRVRIFQKYMKEMSESERLDTIIPEYIFTNPTKLKVYIDSLIEGLKNDYENYKSSEPGMLQKSLHHLRRLSSLKDCNSVIVQISESELHPIFLHLMSGEYPKEIRLEASWLLNNILSLQTTLVSNIVNSSCLKILAAYIDVFRQMEDEQLFEIGLWGIVNLCVESEAAAKSFREDQGFIFLEKQLNAYEDNSSIQETLAWAMTVFSHYSKDLQQNEKQLFVRLSEKFVLQTQQNRQSEIQTYGLRTLYHATNDDNICIYLSKRTQLLTKILSFFHNQQMVPYAIAVICNMLASNSKISKVLLELNVLEYLSIALDNVRIDIRNEALLCISNLLSGDEEEIQSVLDFNRLVDKLFRISQVDSPKNITEVCIGLSNCLGSANNMQVMMLISKGILQIFIGFLQIQDLNITLKTLQGIAFLLDFGEKTKQSDQCNSVKFNLQQLGFEQQLLSLQYHPHDQVYDLAFEILSEYYSDQLHAVTDSYKSIEQEI